MGQVKAAEEVKVTIHEIIDEQRHLMDSGNPVERLAAALLISGVLVERLNHLSDPSIGQLLLDEVWSRLNLLTPESTICLQAVDRLRRSGNSEITNEDIAREQQQPPSCPKCGNEMLHCYGIDEPDFFECVRLTCRYKKPAQRKPATEVKR